MFKISVLKLYKSLMLPAKVMNSRCRSLESLFLALSQETTLYQKSLSMFVTHKAPSASTASPELLLWTFSEKTCHIELSRTINLIEDSVSFERWYSPPSWYVWSRRDSQERRDLYLGDHRPDVEFVVQSLVRVRSRTVCIRPPLGGSSCRSLFTDACRCHSRIN